MSANLAIITILKHKHSLMYKVCLGDGFFRSLHWLVGSLNRLAGPAGGFMALFFHPSRQLHSPPRDVLEAHLTGSDSQKAGRPGPPKWRHLDHCHPGS